ncbi:porin [Enterovibrio baiacu]|uniref:porin n=1 Tax=Enterovibrio baiacu TaxID=2491023 RepID=UPI003D1348C3
MKKTILALAVPALLAAGAANASISLYEEDGTKVELKGAVEVQYRLSGAEDAFGDNNNASGASTNDGQLRVDDGDLAIRITHSEDGENYAFGAIELRIGEDKRSNSVTNAAGDEIGTLDVNASGSGVGDVTNDGLYVGLGGNWGEVSFGRQAALIDDTGVSTEYELKDEAGVDFEDTDFDQLIKYKFNGEGYWFGASYNISQDGDNGASSEELFELAAGVNIIDSLELRGFYGDLDNASQRTGTNGNNVSEDATGWDVELAYTEGPFYVGMLYGNFENTDAVNGVTSDRDTFELAGSYTVGKGKFGAGFAIDEDDKANRDATSYYVNYGYNILENCKVYTEIGFEDVEANNGAGDWDGVGYVAGIELKF